MPGLRDHRIALHDLSDPDFAERAAPLVERREDLLKVRMPTMRPFSITTSEPMLFSAITDTPR